MAIVNSPVFTHKYIRLVVIRKGWWRVNLLTLDVDNRKISEAIYAKLKENLEDFYE